MLETHQYYFPTTSLSLQKGVIHKAPALYATSSIKPFDTVHFGQKAKTEPKTSNPQKPTVFKRVILPLAIGLTIGVASCIGVGFVTAGTLALPAVLIGAAAGLAIAGTVILLTHNKPKPPSTTQTSETSPPKSTHEVDELLRRKQELDQEIQKKGELSEAQQKEYDALSQKISDINQKLLEAQQQYKSISEKINSLQAQKAGYEALLSKNQTLSHDQQQAYNSVIDNIRLAELQLKEIEAQNKELQSANKALIAENESQKKLNAKLHQTTIKIARLMDKAKAKAELQERKKMRETIQKSLTSQKYQYTPFIYPETQAVTPNNKLPETFTRPGIRNSGDYVKNIAPVPTISEIKSNKSISYTIPAVAAEGPLSSIKSPNAMAPFEKEQSPFQRLISSIKGQQELRGKLSINTNAGLTVDWTEDTMGRELWQNFYDSVNHTNVEERPYHTLSGNKMNIAYDPEKNEYTVEMIGNGEFDYEKVIDYGDTSKNDLAFIYHSLQTGQISRYAIETIVNTIKSNTISKKELDQILSTLKDWDITAKGLQRIQNALKDGSVTKEDLQKVLNDLEKGENNEKRHTANPYNTGGFGFGLKDTYTQLISKRLATEFTIQSANWSVSIENGKPEKGENENKFYYTININKEKKTDGCKYILKIPGYQVGKHNGEKFVQSLIDSTRYFYHPTNPDFSNPDFENKDWGFKYLGPEKDVKGNLYRAGQRTAYEERGKYDETVPNFNIWFFRKPMDQWGNYLEPSRDRGPMSERDLKYALEDDFVQKMTVDELKKSIVALQDFWYPHRAAKQLGIELDEFYKHPGSVLLSQMIAALETKEKNTQFQFSPELVALSSPSDGENDSTVKYIREKCYKTLCHPDFKKLGMANMNNAMEIFGKFDPIKPDGEIEIAKIKLLKESAKIYGQYISKHRDIFNSSLIQKLTEQEPLPIYLFDNQKKPHHSNIRAKIVDGKDGNAIFMDQKFFASKSFTDVLIAYLRENCSSSGYSHNSDAIEASIANAVLSMMTDSKAQEETKQLSVLSELWNESLPKEEPKVMSFLDALQSAAIA